MRKARWIAMAATALLWAALSGSAARAASAVDPFVDTTATSALKQPIALAQLPNHKLLVAQKGGALVLVAGKSKRTLATVPVCDGGEMGLLGIALDPAFASNGYIYLYRTKAAPGGCGGPGGRFNQIVRVTMTGETIDLSSLTELLTGIRTDTGAHNAGALRIGPDGKLYASVGDTALGDNQGGPGDSTNPYAQDLGSLNGKILRINLDGSVPADNPFVGMPGARPEIFALGFRNPFRMGFDKATGRLWVGDVGDFTLEELDIVVSAGNYGWPHCEGTLPAGCEQPGDIPPVFAYPHTGPGALGSSILGGDFAPQGFGGFDGHYFFGDFIAGKLYYSALNGTRDALSGDIGTAVTGVGQFYGGPVDIVFERDRALYYTQFNPGEIHRVIPPGFDELLAGKSLTLKITGSSKTMKVLAKDPIVGIGAGKGSADDPTLHGGSLRVVGADFDQSFALASGNWSYTGKPGKHTGLKYKTTGGSAVTSVKIKNGKTVKIQGAGSSLPHTLTSNPAPVSIDLRIASKHYCATFGGETTFSAGKKFVAKKAAPAAECPP
jgi:glucose/arabinose dehydrogenase